MSTTAPGIDAPQLCATGLIAHPGTLPTVTIPLVRDCPPDVGAIWRYLQEPAEFFGYPMPAPGELAAALAEFSATAFNHVNTTLIVVGITITKTDAAPRTLVTGDAVQPFRSDAVRVARDDSVPFPHRATDQWWLRMAARTTSRGALDQRERWLNGRGYADVVSDGVPMLGALVFETDGSVVGVENPEPTSILAQLEHCGVIAAIDRQPAAVADPGRVWWVSPRYQTHPVAEFGGTCHPADSATVPSFARWS